MNSQMKTCVDFCVDFVWIFVQKPSINCAIFGLQKFTRNSLRFSLLARNSFPFGFPFGFPFWVSILGFLRRALFGFFHSVHSKRPLSRNSFPFGFPFWDSCAGPYISIENPLRQSGRVNFDLTMRRAILPLRSVPCLTRVTVPEDALALQRVIFKD